MGRAQAGKGWRGKRKARVFVVDDHEIVRQGLGWLLGNTSDLMVCGEARDAGEALIGLATAQVDKVVNKVQQ